MSFNGQIKIDIVNNKLRLETGVDPILACLCLLKVALTLLERQVSKPKDVVFPMGGGF